MDRDRFMTYMWKNFRAILSCVTPGKEIPQFESKDFSQFLMLNNAWAALEHPKNMDSGVDTT